jgi:hypothetical protein
MINELERILKETIVAEFEVRPLSRHVPGSVEVTHETLYYSRSPGRDLNKGRTEYEG